MESIKESCEPSDADWSKEPLITLMEAAENGIVEAQTELIKRRAQIERDIATLSNTPTQIIG
jgi:hypothetical protein